MCCSLKTKIKKRKTIERQVRKVKFLMWVDKRPVFIITTCKNHDGEVHDTGKKKTDVPVLKPNAVIDYNAAKKMWILGFSYCFIRILWNFFC